jgi:fatty acid desaturase/predicted heme/steroid binding protein
MKYTLAQVAKHDKRDDAWLVVENKVYDVTSFVASHPGGRDTIMSQVGRDGTDAFASFHPAHVEGMLAEYYIGDLVGAPAVPEIVKDFRDLRRKARAAGLFNSNKLYYVFKMAQVASLGLMGLAILYFYPESKYTRFLSALVMGLFWQQAGWLGHDITHHQISQNRDVNNYISLIYANFFQGFSGDWWKNKHNTHHAACNEAGHDPDIDTLPLLAWSHKLLKPELAESKVARFAVLYQPFLFFPLLFFARISWAIQSAMYTFESPKNNFVKLRALERFFIVLHWAFFCGFAFWVLPFQQACSWILLGNGFAGLLIACVFSVSHNGMHVLDAVEQSKTDFYTEQILTTRNVDSNIVWDFFTGGLNYQLEHHIYPSMPRHNFHKIAPMVKSLVLKHGLKYEIVPFHVGNMLVLKHLANVAEVAEKKVFS